MYYYISYTLFFVLNTQFCWKQLSITDFAIVAKDGLFWLSIVTSAQLICDVPQNVGYWHCDIIMTTMASQITSLTIVYSIFYSGTDKKNQSSESLALCGEFTCDWWIPCT